jgi:DNA-binding CsgD family transcriptional regulator/tetratricopeptide (TPR) repeat protein
MTGPAISLHVPMVAREAEVARLQEAIDGAAGGAARIVLVCGDAGIGKTTIARWAADYARARGFTVMNGRFLESASLPFLPFLQAMLPALADGGLLGEESLGRDAAVLSALGGTGGTVAEEISGPAGNIDAALAAGLLALARKSPILFVVDDLQWAEPASVAAISHIAAAISNAAASAHLSACLLLLYRPLEEGSLVAGAVARIRREPSAREVPITGLDEPQTGELVRRYTDATCTPLLLQTLVATTGGNPLFIREVLTQLAAQDLLRKERGVLSTTRRPDTIPLPSELTSSVADRANRLSLPCRDAIATLALWGDECPLALIEPVTGSNLAAVAPLLDEALRAGMLVEAAGAYRFAHPVIRNVFLHLQGPATRAIAHHALAQRLEGLPDADTLYPREVAHHLVAAGIVASPAELGVWAYRAGDVSLDRYAYAEAGRLFEAALDSEPIVETLAPSDRARLTYRAGFAHYRNMEVAESFARFAEAIDAYESLGDIKGWGAALEGWLRAQVSHGRFGAEGVDQSSWETFDAASSGDTVARARAMAAWAAALRHRSGPEAVAVASEALSLGEAAGDLLACVHACVVIALGQLRQLRPQEALEYNQLGARYAARMSDPWFQGWALINIPISLIAMGHLEEAAAASREALAHAEGVGDWANQASAVATLAVIATIRGHFNEADESAARAAMLIQRSDYPSAAVTLFPALGQAHGLRGDWPQALETIAAMEANVGPAGPWAARQLVRALSGELDSVRAEVAANLRHATWGSGVDQFVLASVAARVDLARALAMPEIAAFTGEIARAAIERANVFAPGAGQLLERLAGSEAALRGNYRDAREHLVRAVEQGELANALPELAMAHLDLAECLSDGDLATVAEITDHLRSALRICDELGMPPIATRARVLAAKLGIELPAALIASPDTVAGTPEGAASLQAGYPAGLSAREVEVLRLIAAGRTNRQIGEELFISLNTVARHVSHIFTKTDAANRADAAAYATRNGLTG